MKRFPSLKLAALIFILLGLVCGNFLYQALTHHNWYVAVDRSFFQFFALLATWLVSKQTPIVQ